MKRMTLTTLLLGTALLGLTFLSPARAAGEDPGLAGEFAEILPNLASPDLSEQEASQQRLQKFCYAFGAPGLEAERDELNSLMAEQLGKPIDPVAKTWILFQLGRTGSDKEVDAIALLLNDSDFRVRKQALRSLALINTDKAAAALKKGADESEGEVKAEIEATLKVLNYDFTIPLETEWPLCLPYADDAQVEAWMAGYGEMDVTMKARTLASLAVRGDRKYRSYAVDAANSSDPDLKRDGLYALEKLGTVEDIPLLLDNARIPEWQETALIIGIRIEYPGFDEELMNRLEKENDPDRFCDLVKILVPRYQTAALPFIFDAAQRWSKERPWLLIAADRLMEKDDLPRFVQLMLTVKSQADRESHEKIVTRIVEGNSEPVIALMNDSNRFLLYPLLGRIGDQKGFDILTESLKSTNKAEQNAAVKGICNTPNAVYADTLMEIFNNTKMSEPNRIAALRAYIRVISLPEYEVGIQITEQEQLEALKKAFEISKRNEEKNLIIDRAKSIRIPESLAFVTPFLDDPALSKTAVTTILELSHHDFMRKQSPDEFAAALEKIAKIADNPDQAEDAAQYRKLID